MPDEPKPRWLLTCSCGWVREFLQRWAAESAARLHFRLGDPRTTHIVRIEPPPSETRRQSDLPPS